MVVQQMSKDMYQITKCMHFNLVLNINLKISENNLIFHYHKYDRDYDNATYLDEYYSESFVVKR